MGYFKFAFLINSAKTNCYQYSRFTFDYTSVIYAVHKLWDLLNRHGILWHGRFGTWDLAVWEFCHGIILSGHYLLVCISMLRGLVSFFSLQ